MLYHEVTKLWHRTQNASVLLSSLPQSNYRALGRVVPLFPQLFSLRMVQAGSISIPLLTIDLIYFTEPCQKLWFYAKESELHLKPALNQFSLGIPLYSFFHFWSWASHSLLYTRTDDLQNIYSEVIFLAHQTWQFIIKPQNYFSRKRPLKIT